MPAIISYYNSINLNKQDNVGKITYKGELYLGINKTFQAF